MKSEEIKTVKIEFDGVEADHFKSAIKKIFEESSKIGFTNSINLNADEAKIIKDINSSLNPK